MMRFVCGPGLALAAVVAAVAAPARPAHASDKRVVAVLYFDNNTGDLAMDVLKKGFADMMITDLAAVDGIVVVERDKLQALLDEITLHKSPYIDKSTAVTLGKGLGARYAVTGAFHARTPALRIDMRMIDVSTGEVLVSAKVTGKDSEVFELEQKLVAEFVSAMKLRFAASGRPRTRVPDVDTLIEYSKGVDLADRGLYEDATQAMTAVVQRAPSFALARMRRDELAKRVAAASARRSDLRADLSAELAKTVEDTLARGDMSKFTAPEDAKAHIAYRALRGRFILRALRKHVSSRSPHVVMAPKEARRLMKAYYANGELLLRELDVYAQRFTVTYPNGLVHLDTRFELPREAQERARQAGLDTSMSRELGAARVWLAEFLLLGHGHDGSERVTIAPPLAELEPRLAKVGYKLLGDAWAEAHAGIAAEPHRMRAASAALESHAEALLIRGKQDEAIAKLQEILDRYPTADNYEYYERRIKQELGLVHDDRVKRLERYAEGLKTCKDMDLRVGWGAIIYRRLRMAGLAAVDATVAEIEKHCRGKASIALFWPYLYSHAALVGGEHGDCRMFDSYMKKFLDHGGSRSDAAGYRKNYSKCPAPGGAP